MVDTSNGNAGLMRRIVQLETEKDELQRDIETLCMQQSGYTGGLDVASRMQARRAAGFEQELEACKQKLALHTKDNHRMQEELAESYRAKGRVADAFKGAMDKNKELEKEVKFYQSRMAGAFTERDKALLDVERLHRTETSILNELKDLHNRLEKTNGQYSEQEKSYTGLQQRLESSYAELTRVQGVVEKFWQLRENVKENKGLDEEVVDKAQVLLEDNVANWVYGSLTDERNEDASRTAELSLAHLKEELECTKAASTKLQEELERTKAASTKLQEELECTKAAFTKLQEELERTKAASTELQEELILTKVSSSEVHDELAVAKAASLKAHEELVATKAASTQLQEDLILSRAASAELKQKLEEEIVARVEAGQKTTIIATQLTLKKDSLEKELQQLRHQLNVLRTMVSTSLEVEEGQFSLMCENLQHVFETVKSKPLQEETSVAVENQEDSVVMKIINKRKGLRVHFEDEGDDKIDNISKDEQETGFHNSGGVMEDDSSKILAQALQEKVEALLLLSQQEERYYLEASTQAALEAQVIVLNQKLAQVTGEKVDALLALADERQQILRLQERERELARLLGQQRNTSINQELEDKPVMKTKQRPLSSGGYLKGWLRGFDISAFKTSLSDSNWSSNVSEVTSPSSKNDGDIGFARLLVENAVLKERVASMQHLAKSANSLRLTLTKVATESQGEPAPLQIQSALETVESVKSEAEQLKVALRCSLPVSFQGRLDSNLDNSYVVNSSEKILEEEGETTVNPQHDWVSIIGVEIAELLLSAADIQTKSLCARRDLLSPAL